MDSLETKDLIAACIIFFLMYTFGAFGVGFIGACFGVHAPTTVIISWLLVFGLPIIFLWKRSRKH